MGAARSAILGAPPRDMTPFAAIPPQARSPELFQANAVIAALVTQRAIDVLGQLGIAPGPLAHPDAWAPALAEQAGVQPQRRSAFTWLLELLASRGRVVDPGDGGPPRLEPPPWSGEELAQAVREASPGVAPSVALIERAAEHYPAVLRGERLGARVLFSAAALPLWTAYFSNDHPVNASVNALAAQAAAAALSGQALRILEVGSGCGSSAIALLEALGDRVGRLVLSDVAPVLLARGRRAVQAAFPAAPVEARTLDVDRPLAEQGVEAASFDLVLGVNILHAAEDVEASLRALRGALAPGGALVLGEATRAAPSRPVPLELVFQLSDAFAGFLPWAAWPPLLRRAGFEQVETLPADMKRCVEAYPDFTLCALVAR